MITFILIVLTILIVVVGAIAIVAHQRINNIFDSHIRVIQDLRTLKDRDGGFRK